MTHTSGSGQSRDDSFSALLAQATAANAKSDQFVKAVGAIANEVTKIMPTGVPTIRVGRWTFQKDGTFNRLGSGAPFFVTFHYQLTWRDGRYGDVGHGTMHARRVFLRKLPKLLAKIETRTGQHVATIMKDIQALNLATEAAQLS